MVDIDFTRASAPAFGEPGIHVVPPSAAVGTMEPSVDEPPDPPYF